MRLSGRWLFALVAVALLAPRVLEWRSALADAAGSFDRGGARRAVAFRVDRSMSATFELPLRADGLELVTNAVLEPSERSAGTIGEKWRYALDVTMLADDGETIDASRRHLVTRRSLYRSAGGEVGPGSFLADPGNGAMTDGKLTPLPLPPAGSPAAVRVALAEAGPEVRAVLVRLYVREPIPESEGERTWRRASAGERRWMARGNVFPLELLTDLERGRLLRHRWSPAAPRGEPGEEYRRVHLYVVGEPGVRLAEEPIEPSGLPLVAGLRAVVRLPDGESDLRVAARSIDGSPPAAATPLVVRHLDPQGRPLAVHSVPWTDGRAAASRRLAGGFAEIESERSAAVEAVAVVDGEAVATAGASTLRAPRCDLEPVVWALSHLDGRATPLRITLRRAVPPGHEERGPFDAVARYRWLDAGGGELGGGRLVHRAALSAYDWVELPAARLRLTDPSRHHLPAPPRAAAVEVSGCTTLTAVWAQVRPPDLPYRLEVPAAYDREPAPAWFALRPMRPGEQELDETALVLRLQERPPTPAAAPPEEYAWDGFLPDGRWTGRQLLVPATRPGAPRPEALASSFVELACGEPRRMRLAARDPGRDPRPDLLFARTGEGPFDLALRVDGQPVVERQLVGRSGALGLPAVARGERLVEARCEPGTRLFLSHVAAAGDGAPPRWVLRLAFRVPTGPFRVSVAKVGAGTETISARLHLPAGSTATPIVEARLLGVESRRRSGTAEWTFDLRTWGVRPAGGAAALVLGDDGLTLDLGQPFFLPLGGDLPPGDYTLELSVRGVPAETHLALSRIAPGSHDERFVFSAERDEGTREVGDAG